MLRLTISNQSFVKPVVQVRVVLDESNLIVNDYFSIENQHNFKEYFFPLHDNNHSLKITTKDNLITKNFNTKNNKNIFNVVIMIWNDGTEESVTFDISKEPFLFL